MFFLDKTFVLRILTLALVEIHDLHDHWMLAITSSEPWLIYLLCLIFLEHNFFKMTFICLKIFVKNLRISLHLGFYFSIVLFCPIYIPYSSFLVLNSVSFVILSILYISLSSFISFWILHIALNPLYLFESFISLWILKISLYIPLWIL